LVEHAVAVVHQITPHAFILGSGFELPASLRELEVLPDAVPHGGPIAGLCSLLARAAGRWALMVGCDMPCLQPSLLTRLLKSRTTQADAVVYENLQCPGTYHACCAAYHPRALPRARHVLTSGTGSVHALLADSSVVALQPDADETRALTNINTPADWARWHGRSS